MKTKEELNALKKEVEALNGKLRELTEDELAQVTGGMKQKLIPPLFPLDILPPFIPVEDAAPADAEAFVGVKPSSKKIDP